MSPTLATGRRSLLIPLLACLLCVLPGRTEAVKVNAPRPITHTLTVQPIRVQSSDGTISATYFGEPFKEQYIKAQINVVLAQAGINVEWMPLVDYQNDFALDGSPGNYDFTPRPESHLQTILNDAPSPPKSTNALVLNIFFVDIAPDFPRYPFGLEGGIAVGSAKEDANGISMGIASDLLTSYGWGGLETIAGAVAHEIGHNLGLIHQPSNADNLMADGWSTWELVSEKLTPAQITTIFTDKPGIDGFDFLTPYVPPTNFSVWADEFELDEGPEGDDDGDKIVNILEFMLGLDPTTPDHHALPTPLWDASGLIWTIPKLSDATDDGLVYAIEVSTDCSTWVPAGTAGSGSTVVTDTATTLTVRLNTGFAWNFMRIAVNLSTL